MGAGVIAGAAAGLLWFAARHYGRDRAGEIIDWDQARSVALRTAQATPWLDSGERAAAEADYVDMLREVAGPLQRYTGSEFDIARSGVRALDRPEWISANMANFRDLLRPFEELYREKVDPARVQLPGITAAGRLVLSAEVGVLLGYLGRRVLGQYDISLLGTRAREPGALYFVEPNIRSIQLQLGLPQREFRMWLALHEATHVHEFEGHPWVRDYLNQTIQRYIESMVDHLRDGGGSIKGLVGRAMDHLSIGGSLLEAMMTPTQRGMVSRLQAVMCLLEGYSNHVMNALGRDLLPHYVQIEARVEERSKRRSGAEQLFLRVTGLQMKFDQYRLGAEFVDRVVQDRGIAFLNQVWHSAEMLPSEQEIREPARWIDRVTAAA